jgi:hypothetical protein
MVRLEGLGKFKNPITSSGIEPATIRLVAQCLNQLCYRVPQISCALGCLHLFCIRGGCNYLHDTNCIKLNVSTFVLACISLSLTALFASLWLARLVKGDRRLYT